MGLDQIKIRSEGDYYIGLYEIRFDRMGLDWIRLNQMRLDWIRLERMLFFQRP